MGTFAEGSIQIYLNSEKDADKVCEMIKNIKERTDKRLKQEGHFAIHDLDVHGEMVEIRLSSGRIQNCEFQMNMIVDELKVMVQSKEITEVLEYTSNMMIDGGGGYMEGEEFLEPPRQPKEEVMFYYEVHVVQSINEGYGVPVKSVKELDDAEAIELAISSGDITEDEVVDYVEPLTKEEYEESFI